jgi:hypothetical protein
VGGVVFGLKVDNAVEFLFIQIYLILIDRHLDIPFLPPTHTVAALVRLVLPALL